MNNDPIRDKIQVVSKGTTHSKVKSKEAKWNLISGILFKKTQSRMLKYCVTAFSAIREKSTEYFSFSSILASSFRKTSYSPI